MLGGEAATFASLLFVKVFNSLRQILPPGDLAAPHEGGPTRQFRQGHRFGAGRASPVATLTALRHRATFSVGHQRGTNNLSARRIS